MRVRSIRQEDIELAGTLLCQAFERAARTRGHEPPWPDDAAAAVYLRGLRARSARTADAVVVAEEGGAVVGVGAVRVRGEVASIGPIAAYADGRGIGGALLDELLGRADSAGASATRLYADAWNPPAFALYTGRGFSVTDMVLHVERAVAPPPRLDSSRGLEVRPFAPGDDAVLDQVVRLDTALTGHERRADLADGLRLVARRRGDVVGYLAAAPGEREVLLGPAVAVDASDLFTLVCQALAGPEDHALSELAGARDAAGGGDAAGVRARLSTAAPVAATAALGLGFRIRELGVVLSRGAPPPARPPQLYSLSPEML